MGTNLLQSGAAWLGGQLKAHAGRTVTLTAGQLTIENLQCSAAQFEHEILDDDGFATRILSYDWTFTAADLFVGDVPVNLRPGVIVTETLNGVTSKYEAMTLGSRPALERLDSSGILMILHTKKIQ